MDDLVRVIIDRIGTEPVAWDRAGDAVMMNWHDTSGIATVVIDPAMLARLQVRITAAGGFFELSIQQAASGSPVLDDAVRLLRENLQ